MLRPITINPKLDLVLQRDVDVSPELVWDAWTKPEQLKIWFTPRPWTVSHCELDVRPGGRCITTMRSPEGQEFPNVGCYLEVVSQRRLTFTDALLGDYRPTGKGYMTATIEIEPRGGGTRYTATVLHASEADRESHEAMGFAQGWGTALEQLVKMVKGVKF